MHVIVIMTGLKDELDAAKLLSAFRPIPHRISHVITGWIYEYQYRIREGMCTGRKG